MSAYPARSIYALVLCWSVFPVAAVQAEQEKDPPVPLPQSELRCSVIHLEHGSCVTIVKRLRELFEGHDEQMHKLVCYEHVGAVLVRATEEETEQIQKLIAGIDVPLPEEEEVQPAAAPRELQIIAVRHASAKPLAALVRSILGEKRRGRRHVTHPGPELVVDERTNQIIMHGTDDEISSAKALIALLDVPLERPKPTE